MKERKNYITQKQFLKKHPEEEKSLNKAFEALLFKKPHIIGTVRLTFQVDYESYLNKKEGKVKTLLRETFREITYKYE